MIDARVAIVGAGPSGLAACQVLAQRGIPFDCFEKGSDVGGLWRYENDNALASAYATLHLNTSRKTARYTSYPMPEHYPDFPHHTQMLAYLEDYAEHFGLRTASASARRSRQSSPRAGPGRCAGARATARRRAHATQPCSSQAGTTGSPRQLDLGLPGQRSRESSCTPTSTGPRRAFAGKNVLVVGVGDSAMDIACDISRVSRMTFLAARRGAWIVPKYLGGAPLGEVGRQAPIPPANRRRGGLGHAVQHRPPHVRAQNRTDPRTATGPRSARARSRVRRRDADGLRGASSRASGIGRVTPKPWISRSTANGCTSRTVQSRSIDAIVYCIGYKIALPFLAADVLDPKDEAPLCTGESCTRIVRAFTSSG